MAGLSVKLLVCSLVLLGFYSAALPASAPGGEPNYQEYAKMARFLVHRLDWAVMATISSIPELSGYPMVDVVSMADSARDGDSTGEIYMLLTDLHFSEQDLLQNNTLTLLFSMAQYKNCSDPMEPTCARLMMTGSMKRIDNTTEEHAFGLNAMFSRHPVAERSWVLYPYHGWYLAKVKIEYLMLQDFYGRPNVIPVADYWEADPNAYSPPSKSYRRTGRRNLYPRRPLSGASQPRTQEELKTRRTRS